MSNAQLEGELENEFSDFGLDIDGNISVLEKCKSTYRSNVFASFIDNQACTFTELF